MESSKLLTICKRPNLERELLKVTIDDFELGKVVGQGAYGKVIVSRFKSNGQVVAIKTVSKD